MAVAAIFGSPRDARIVLVPDVQFQVIRGWEVATDLPDAPVRPPFAGHEAEMIDAVAGAGIDRIRLEVRSGAETRNRAPSRMISGGIDYAQWQTLRYAPSNDNADPFDIDPEGFDFAELDWHVRTYVLPLRARLAQEGKRLTVSLCYVSFRDGRFFQMEPEEYAEFILAAVLHLDRTWGIVPDLVEVILEPDLPVAGWTGTDIGRAMVAADRRLRDAGYAPGFVAPSVTNMSNALPYAREIAQVPGAAGVWRELSYHRYSGTSPSELARIAAFAAEAGLDTAMLELWFGRADRETLWRDLTIGGVGAWQGRTLPGMLDPSDLAAASAAGRPPALQPEMRDNSLVFRAAPAGSVRIGADSSSDAYRALGFRRPDGALSLVVFARSSGRLTIAGLDPGPYRVVKLFERRSSEATLGTDDAGTLEVALEGARALMLVGRANGSATLAPAEFGGEGG